MDRRRGRPHDALRMEPVLSTGTTEGEGLHCKVKTTDASPLRRAPSCPCTNEPNLSQQTLLVCPGWDKECETLLDGHQRAASWESLVGTQIKPRKLLEFMADTAHITTRKLVNNYEDAQEADYELGVDI